VTKGHPHRNLKWRCAFLLSDKLCEYSFGRDGLKADSCHHGDYHMLGIAVHGTRAYQQFERMYVFITCGGRKNFQQAGRAGFDTGRQEDRRAERNRKLIY
jgi:hypothetical protein